MSLVSVCLSVCVGAGVEGRRKEAALGYVKLELPTEQTGEDIQEKVSRNVGLS